MAMNDYKLIHKLSPIACDTAMQVFENVKDKLTWENEENILDVGSGTAAVTTNVLTKYIPDNSTIIASDISEDMINYAKVKYSNSKIKFKVLDIVDNNLWEEWTKQQFTKIFAFYVIHRIENDRKAYENMFNLLKSGGEMFLLFPIISDLDKISTNLAKMPKYSNYAEKIAKMKFHFFPRDDYVSYINGLLKSIGFDVIVCKPIRVAAKIDSINDAISLFGLVTPLSSILPQNLFEEALKDSINIIEENKIINHDENGFYFYHTLFAAIAKKPL